MLDRKEVEKLGNLAGLAPFVRIPSPAFEELLRVYRAWLDAPAACMATSATVDTINDRARVRLSADAGGDAARLVGQTVRLVRDGDSGEGLK